MTSSMVTGKESMSYFNYLSMKIKWLVVFLFLSRLQEREKIWEETKTNRFWLLTYFLLLERPPIRRNIKSPLQGDGILAKGLELVGFHRHRKVCALLVALAPGAECCTIQGKLWITSHCVHTEVLLETTILEAWKLLLVCDSKTHWTRSSTTKILCTMFKEEWCSSCASTGRLLLHYQYFVSGHKTHNLVCLLLS
jgi:hypothetical protein